MFYSALGMAVLFLVNACQKPEMQAADPVLSLDKETVEVPAAGGPVSVGYSVENPVEGVKAKASVPANDWVTGLSVGDKEISFTVAAKLDLDKDREIVVTVSYEGADSKTFKVLQTANPNRPVLSLESNTYEATIEGGAGSVKFTLVNPVEGATLTASLDESVSWVKDLSVDMEASAVTFTVDPNDTYDPRSVSVSLTYSAISTPLSFTINQAASVKPADIVGTWYFDGGAEFSIAEGSEAGKYIVSDIFFGQDWTATRDGNTLTLDAYAGSPVNVGDPHGTVTPTFCAYHIDYNGELYLWADEVCKFEFTDETMTAVNGVFIGFQSPVDEAWYNWTGSVIEPGVQGTRDGGSTVLPDDPAIAAWVGTWNVSSDSKLEWALEGTSLSPSIVSEPMTGTFTIEADPETPGMMYIYGWSRAAGTQEVPAVGFINEDGALEVYSGVAVGEADEEGYAPTWLSCCEVPGEAGLYTVSGEYPAYTFTLNGDTATSLRYTGDLSGGNTFTVLSLDIYAENSATQKVMIYGGMEDFPAYYFAGDITMTKEGAATNGLKSISRLGASAVRMATTVDQVCMPKYLPANISVLSSK